METLPEWEVGVKDGLVTLRRGNWQPVKLSKRQAKELSRGIGKALIFLEEGPQFEPIRIGQSIQNKGR